MLLSWILPGLKEVDYAAVCDRCQWPTPFELDKSEKVGMKQMQQMTAEMQYEAGMNMDVYYEEISKLAPGLLEQLRVAGENWICEACGTRNQATFAECWKCSAEAPEGAAQVEPEERKITDGSVKNPNMPWEGF